MKKTIILLFVLFATLTLFADPILSEGFETWPPTGWTLDPADGSGSWVQNDGTSYGPGASYEGTNAAMFNNYSYSSGTTGSIITPSLDLTAMSSPVLSFYWWNGDSESNPATLTIATTTNGTDWTDVLVIPVFGTTDWANVILPLTTDVTDVKFTALSDWGMKNTYLDAVTIDEAPANPVFAIEPDSVGFGTVNVNSSSDMQEFTISNTSGGNLIIDANISITGDDVADFVLTDTNTYPINLGLNEVATIGVAFAPLSDGEKSAFLSIVDNITRTTHEIPLTGEGYQMPADLVQIGNGAETNKHLPIEPYYGYSYSQSIYLASDFGTIDADQRISKIYYNYHWTSNSDDDENDWVIYMGTTAMTEVDSVWTPIDGMTEVFNGSVGLDAVENGDGWLEITLSTPFNYNPSDGNLMIAVDENTPSYTSSSDEFYCSEDTRVNVSRYYYSDSNNLDPADPSQAGTVSAFYPNARFQFEDIPAIPQFAVAPESFDFGQTNVGVTSDAQTFTLMNNGQGSLTINSVTLDNDANFILTDTNSYPVELTDNTITFDVAFAPTEAIDYSANVIVTDNQRVEHLIPITGLGYVPPVGDTIENPFVVAFTDGQFIAVDSTNYMNNDYDLPGSDNNDAVYQFTLEEDMTVDVSLLGSAYDTKLAIYADSTDIEGWVPGPANYLFYDDDYSGKSASSPVTKESKNKKDRVLQSAIYGMPLTAGSYFAIVDGFGSNNGVYNIEIDAAIPTVLNPPENLTADVDDSNVTLTWEAPAIDGRELTGFKVYRNGTMIQEITDPAILTYTDENLANGTYEYYATATYTDGESDPSNTVEVTIDIVVLNPPENLTASVNEQDVTLNWDAPAGQGGLLQWDDGINYTAIGANGPFNFDVVSRFEPADLANYDGLYLTQISFFPNEADCVYSLKVWQGGHAIAGQDTIPGTLLAEQAIDTANLTIGDWNTIVLDTPITIDASQELWFGYNADTQVGFPAGCDAGPAIAGKGDIIYDAEDGWATISGFGLNYNWNIAGIVEGSAKNVAFKLSQASKENVVNETRSLTGYKLYRNDVEITTITDITNLQYVDQGVEPGDYTYYVTAIYDAGESDPSNTVDVTVEVPVYNPPENLTVTVNNHNAVLQWDAPGTGGGTEDVNEGFESGVIPTDWTIIDADGDTYNWDIAPEGITAHSGDYCVLSSSYINGVGALTPDNYLITPQIAVGNNATLDFWECAQDPAWAGEHYYVKVSTTGTDPADFTNIIHDETLVDGDWHEINVSLADFAGQNIYIAFEHCEVTDMFAMKLDDIVVSGSSKTINFTFNTNSSKNIPVMNITKSVEGAKFFAEMTNDRQNRELTGFKVYRNDEMIHEIDNAGASNYIDVNLPDGDFTYYVTAMYGDNESVASNSVTINIVGNNDVNNNFVTSLSRNYPNPFNPETTISYSLKDNGFVSIEVYNVLGQKVKTLVNNNVVAGPHQVTWKGHDDNNKNVSSGIYFYRMKTGNYTSTKKMILMK